MSRAPRDRPSTAGEFAAELAVTRSGVGDSTALRPVPAGDQYDRTMIAPTPTPPPVSSPNAAGQPAPAASGSRRRWALPAAATAAVLVGAAVAGAILLNRSPGSETPTAAIDTPPSIAVSTAAGPATVTAAPSTVTVQPTATVTAPTRPSVDLGLATPVSTPASDGRYILALVSIEESNPSLRALITARLTAEPTATYFYSGALDCGSINAVDANGERFYTAYIDYGTDLRAACYAVQHRGGAYVRTLRNGVAIGTNPCG